MGSRSDSALFLQIDWSRLIDNYKKQRLDYEKKRNIAFTNILKLKKSKRKKRNPVLQNPILSKDALQQFSVLLDQACKNAEKYEISSSGIQEVNRSLNFSNDSFLYFAYKMPDNHLWIDVPYPLHDKIGGAFFYNIDIEYKRIYYSKKEENIDLTAIKPIIQKDDGKWTLETLNIQGAPIISLKYHTSFNRWEYSYPHVCPRNQCQYVVVVDQLGTRRRKLQPCQTCHDAFEYCLAWFFTAYRLITENASSNQSNTIRNISLKPLPLSTSQPQKNTSLPQPQSQKKPIVASPLLIHRYINQSNEKKAQSIEQAHKYLWMHSAWIMTETLRHTTDNIQSYLPTQSVYIELEQPRRLHKQQIAAISFLRNDQHDLWTLSIIDNEGKVAWTTFHEKNTWTLPKDYICPEQKCSVEKHQTGTTYALCETCQERITYYTTWLTTALHMIAGDFREKVDMQEPEEVLETTTRMVQDEKSGKKKEIHTLHRYKIIQYYDASKYKGKEPRTKRGSWMSGRPLAESEYELNPDAVIYVQIQPRDYHKTYHHKRYIHVRGKTEHIEPGPRPQPITIATFRNLKKIQKITRVFASAFDN